MSRPRNEVRSRAGFSNAGAISRLAARVAILDAGRATLEIANAAQLNARLDAPGGLHITLFEELRGLDERESLAGFSTDEDR